MNGDLKDLEPVPEELTKFAGLLADTAREATLPLFRSPVEVTDKARGDTPFDPVTAADRASETEMRALIEQRYPDHGIIGEELPERTGKSDFTWILDPIDGTRSFITGMPVWGTLIGLCRRGEPIIGVMDQPFTGERFIGAGGKASYRRGEETLPLATSRCRRLGDARFATTDPALFTGPGQEHVHRALHARARLTRYGGDCYLYCMLAGGHIDLVVEAGLNIYDIAPLVPIIEGAGGVVTTWSGQSAAGGGDIIAAASKSLHQETLEIIPG